MYLLRRRFSNVTIEEADTCYCLEAAMGNGGGNVPIICFDSHDLIIDTKSPTLISGGEDKARIPIVAFKENETDERSTGNRS